MNKSVVTDIVSFTLIGISFIVPQNLQHVILFTGLFALSGALTNQIAIHMLFERVPLLYGSGVIPLRFEAFKASIKELMMNQFFYRRTTRQLF